MPKSLYIYINKFLVNAKLDLVTNCILKPRNTNLLIYYLHRNRINFSHTKNQLRFSTTNMLENPIVKNGLQNHQKLPLAHKLSRPPSNTMFSAWLYSKRQLDYLPHFHTVMPQISRWLHPPKKLPLIMIWSAPTPTLHILSPTWPTNPNGIRIQSAIFSQLTGQTHRLTDTEKKCGKRPVQTGHLSKRRRGLIIIIIVVIVCIIITVKSILLCSSKYM